MPSGIGFSCVLTGSELAQDLPGVGDLPEGVVALELDSGIYSIYECAPFEAAMGAGAPPISGIEAVEAFAQGFALFVPVAAAIWGGRVILKLIKRA